MPEVDWTPNPPGIQLYSEEDWSWMNEEDMGLRKEGAKYVTFPLHIKRIYGTVQYTPPKRTFRQKMHDKVLAVAWRIINHYEES